MSRGAELLRALHAAGVTVLVEGGELVVEGPEAALAELAADLEAWSGVLWTLHHPGARALLAEWPAFALAELREARAALEADGTPRELASKLALLDVGTRYAVDDEGTWTPLQAQTG